MYDLNFCPSCGKELPSGATYCPQCGNSMGGPAADTGNEQFEKGKNLERAKIAGVLILINGIILIALGLWIYVDAAEIMRQAVDAYPELFVDLDVGAITSVMESMGIAAVLFGIAGLVSAGLTFARKLWPVALVLCLLSALVGIFSLIGIVLGLIAFWLILKAKPVFT